MQPVTNRAESTIILRARRRRIRRGPCLASAAIMAIALPLDLIAADRYYVGPDNGLWNDTANWSTTSGGSPGASVPGAGDRALITHSDGTTRTVTYDYAGSPVTLQQVSVNNSGAGSTTFIHTANLLNTGSFIVGDAGSGHWAMSEGTLNITGTSSTGVLNFGSTSTGTGAGTLSGGTLLVLESAAVVNVGMNGSGTFTQSAGTASLNFLALGRASGSHGVYRLSGSAELSTNGSYVGYNGSGTFGQSGGTHATVGLTVGNLPSSSGTYQFSGGILDVVSEVIGYSGAGTFRQSGGTHTVDSELFMGNTTLGSGTYVLDDGTLTVSNGSYAGYNGTGTFTQNGGLHTTGTLYAGALGTGTYTLTGGTLTSVTDKIGYGGSGTFNQTGGTHSITGFGVNPGLLSLGETVDGVGYVGLSDGALTTDGFLIVGQNGQGTVLQSGGTHTIIGNKNVKIGDAATGAGTFNLSGGEFTANVAGEFIGLGGSGTFIQSGGTHTVQSTGQSFLTIAAYGNSEGRYLMSGGTLTAKAYVAVGSQGAGTFDQSAGMHTVGTAAANEALVVGEYLGSTGTYLLGGSGILNVHGNEFVGYSGNGRFIQSGGVHTIGTSITPRNLLLGATTDGNGIFISNNNAAQLQIHGSAYVGGDAIAARGTGVVQVSAGSANIAGTLKVWNTVNTSVSLSGGTLSVGSLNMDSNPTPARFNWTGGRFNITNSNVAIDNTGPLGNTVNLGSNMTLGISQTLNVNSGGTLAGNGNVIGNVAVNSGGHVAPGASVGQLTLTNLTLNTGAILDYELAAPTSGDRINVTASGGLSLAGITTLNLANLGGLGVGSYILFDYNTSFSGPLSNLSLGTQPGGFNYLIQNNPGNTSIDLLVSSLAAPADRYFVAGDQTVFANAANWSATPNGPGGAGIPVNGDTAYLINNLPGGRSVALGAHAFTGAGLAKLVIDGQTAEEQFLHFDSAGKMIAGEQDIGLSGIGRFNHFAGSNQVTGTMFIGKNEGSQGNYDLTNTATMSFSAITFEGPLLIGYFGTGDLLMKEQAEIKVDGGNVGVGVRDGGIGFVRHDGGLFRMTNVGGSPSMFIGRAEGSNGTYTMTQTAGASTLSIDGNLYAGYQGNGTFIQNAGVVKLNNGYLFVANEATSDGAYIMNGGSLSATEIVVGGFAGGPGGNGSFTFNGGSVSVGQAIRVWQTGAATLSAGTVNVTQDTSIYGQLTVTGGVLNTPGNASGLGMNVQNNATLNVSGGTINIGDFYNYGTINKTGGAINIAGFISGPGFYNQYDGSTKFSPGFAIDTEDVAILGGTAIAEGELLVGMGNVSPGILNVIGGVTTVNGQLGIGNTGVINAGVGTGNVNVSGGSLTASSMLLGSTAGGYGSLTLTGTGYVGINGTVKVTSNGKVSLADTATLVTGTLDLSGSASGLNWTGGTLRINTSAPVTDGALTVPTGGTLGGVGTIARPTSVNTGGSIAPGNSPGTMTFAADLTLSTGSNVELEIGAPTPGTGHDQIIMTSGSTLAINGAQLKLIVLPGIALGVPYTIVDAAAGVVSGTFKYLEDDLFEGGPYVQPGVEYSIHYTSNLVQITISAVPEPSGLFAIIGTGMLLGRRSRRRNRSE